MAGEGRGPADAVERAQPIGKNSVKKNGSCPETENQYAGSTSQLTNARDVPAGDIMALNSVR